MIRSSEIVEGIDNRALEMMPEIVGCSREEILFIDIETTGLSFKFCKIIEIGAVRLDKAGNVIDRFSEFVNPEVPIPYNI